jgi:hypothetical protein
MLNPFLEEKLQALNSPSYLKLLVEMPDIEVVPQAAQELMAMPDIGVVGQAFNFIFVTAPIPSIKLLEGVGLQVHYDMPRGITTANRIKDPLIGEFQVSPITLPLSPSEMALRNLRNIPFAAVSLPSILGAPFGLSPAAIAEPNVIILPTADTRLFMKPPEDSFLRKTRVAVLDTGLSPHPLFNPANVRPTTRSVTPEPPLDLLGHGQWCTTAAFGGKAKTRFGDLQGVATVVGDGLMHVKCLSTLGFGTTSSILKAIEEAIEFGAQIISMSLGGPLQGGINNDPECRVIEALKERAIFVVAAGNSGPTPWTVGSPGASPFAVTVGSYSPFYDGISFFSSRGPNAAWYTDHQDAMHRDAQQYGDDFMKPDCVAPGGGPLKEGDKADMIYSGVTGWTNGMNDRSPIEPFDAMRGTSMATPHAAGAIALAVENGSISSAGGVKRKLAKKGGKDFLSGYGMVTYEDLVS